MEYKGQNYNIKWGYEQFSNIEFNVYSNEKLIYNVEDDYNTLNIYTDVLDFMPMVIYLSLLSKYLKINRKGKLIKKSVNNIVTVIFLPLISVFSLSYFSSIFSFINGLIISIMLTMTLYFPFLIYTNNHKRLFYK